MLVGAAARADINRSVEGRPHPEPVAVPTERVGVAPSVYFVGVTLVGATMMGAARDLDAVAFLAVNAVALLLLRRLELPPGFELTASIGIVLQGWGNALLLFERVGWYDKAVHFLTPMLLVPSLYLLLVRWGLLPAPWHNGLRRGALGVLVVTVALGVAFAGLWEVVEGSADRWLGTNLAHGYFETIDDLYSSILGSAAAAALLTWLVVTEGRTLSRQADGFDPAGERW